MEQSRSVDLVDLSYIKAERVAKRWHMSNVDISAIKEAKSGGHVDLVDVFLDV